MRTPKNGHRRCAVYRHYDATDRLLYIGSSITPDARYYKHLADGAEWAELSVRRTDEWYPSEAEARMAESVAIFEEQPPYNKRRPASLPDPSVDRVDSPTRLSRIPAPPCFGDQPAGMDQSLIRYAAVRRSAWNIGIRGQITDRTVGYIATTLAYYGNPDGGGCAPGVNSLAEDVFCSKRTVINSLRWLTDYGFMYLDSRGKRKLGEVNEYRLALPAPLLADRRLWPQRESWWTDDPDGRPGLPGEGCLTVPAALRARRNTLPAPGDLQQPGATADTRA